MEEGERDLGKQRDHPHKTVSSEKQSFQKNI